MVASVDPRNGIFHTWSLGESGWNTQMDANLLRLATFTGLSVIDRNLTAPPGSPADGDAYIVPAAATGAWAGMTDEIAVWRADSSSWEFYDPSTNRARLLCFIEDENRLAVWNGTDWNLGVAMT